MGRKKTGRVKDGQLTFRLHEWVRDSFAEAIEEVADSVASTTGGPLGQVDVMTWFCVRLKAMPLDERRNFLRDLRRGFQDEQDRREQAAASPQTQAPTPATPEPLAGDTVGGHTRGHKASIADVFGKPRQARPGRGTDRKKMVAEVDR